MTTATQKAYSTQKAYRGMGMEGFVARWYQKSTRKGMGDYQKDARRLAAIRPEGGDVLEVAPGPGFLAIDLARDRRFAVTGLDISKTFVELARQNAMEAGVAVDFQQGNASEMPFAADSFDLLICRAAFKNFSEPVAAIREMKRVLRPGGTGVIIDLRRDVPMAEIRQHINSWGLSAWNRGVIMLTFRFMLLKRAYTKQEFEEMFEGIGFEKVDVRTSDIGIEAWFEK